MKAKLTLLLVAMAVGAFAVAGCGDDDEGSDTGASTPPPASETTQPSETTEPEASGGGGGGETIDIAADPGGALKFDMDALTAKAGEVTIVMDNPSSVPHAVAIRGGGVDESGETIGQGEKSTAGPVELQAGEYEFYCPVGGHEQAGMKGTLTVE